MSTPNVTPMLRWLETQKLLKKGTTEAVNTLADKWKQAVEALRAAGVRI